MLTDTVGFRYAYSKPQDRFAHPTGVLVLTPSGKISRYFYGIRFDPADLGKAVAAAGAEKIGRPVPMYAQVLLLCYDYDPKTGSFSLNVLNAVRLGGAATVIVIASCLVLTWLRSVGGRRAPRRFLRSLTLPARRAPRWGRTTMNPEFTLFPEQASTVAPGVDCLFFFIIGVSVFFSTLTAVLLIYFALRYRRKSDADIPRPIHGSTKWRPCGPASCWSCFW